MPMIAVTNVPADAPLADELVDEDLVEMANLPEEDTRRGLPRPRRVEAPQRALIPQTVLSLAVLGGGLPVARRQTRHRLRVLRGRYQGWGPHPFCSSGGNLGNGRTVRPCLPTA